MGGVAKVSDLNFILRYIVLTSKHCEGWTNWQSATTWNWNAVENGPHMDLIGMCVKHINVIFHIIGYSLL